MRKSMLAGGLLIGALLLSAPAVAAQAKEIPADGSIPLTSEYFPDEWFLEHRAKQYDKDKNGYLSPEEIAAVTEIWCTSDLSDFSQVQYFTNLRKLTAQNIDEENSYDIWLGGELDLTVFPELEDVNLHLDSRRAPAGGSDIQIQLSGLSRLKNFSVYDKALANDQGRDGSGTKIEVIDFRNTKALGHVAVTDAKGVVFDEENQIKEIYLNNVAQIPDSRFSGFKNLERLSVWTNIPEFTQIDLTGLDCLTELSLKNSYLRTVEISGMDALKAADIQSDSLETIDLSVSPCLTELVLECPKLKEIDLSAADALERVTIQSEKLCALNVSENAALKRLSVEADLLKSLDVTKNRGLEHLSVESAALAGLDLKRNKNLKNLSVSCKRMGSLDLSVNTKLTWLVIDGAPLKSLNLSRQKELGQLFFKNNKKLAKLDLSKNTKLRELYVQNTSIKSLDVSKLTKLDLLEITGNKKLTKLDLSRNKKLVVVNVSNNALKTLKLGSKASMNALDCSKNKLTSLDLSKAPYLMELICDQKVQVKGYKGKITRA